MTQNSKNTEAESFHLNTLEQAAERNMYGKKPLELQKQPSIKHHFAVRSNSTKTSNSYRPTFPPIKENEMKNVPRSLYFTNGYMPKLADLRNAIRNNLIFHNRYNPHLDDPEFKRIFDPAINRSPQEQAGKIDEAFEN